MVSVPVALDTNGRLRIGSDGKIYRTSDVNSTLYPNGFTHRLPFVLSRGFTKATLANQQVRFRTTQAGLATIANGGFSNNGLDFLVTTINGTPIPYKIEDYVSGSGFIRGKMLYPNFSITGLNPGYLYVGNPDIAVSNQSNLDTGFVAYWDLPSNIDNSNGDMNFNSAFVSAGTFVGTNASFDGTGGATRTCSITPLIGRSEIVIEVSLNVTDALALYEVFSVGTTNDLTFKLFSDGADKTGAQLRFQGTTGVVEHRYPAGTFVPGTKQHFLMRLRGSGGFTLYKNGQLVSPTFTSGNNVGSFFTSETEFRLGGVNAPFKGIMDNLCIHPSMPNASEVYLRYTNSIFPSTIVGFSPDIETPGVIYDAIENLNLETNANAPIDLNISGTLFSAANRVPTITGITQPNSGSLTQLSSTGLRYTPAPAFTGELSGGGVSVSTA